MIDSQIGLHFFAGLARPGEVFVIWDVNRRHPWLKSEQMNQLRQVLNTTVEVDWCQFGAGDSNGASVRGERTLLTNIQALAQLHRRCDERHPHRPTHGNDDVNKFGWPESAIQKDR